MSVGMNGVSNYTSTYATSSAATKAAEGTEEAKGSKAAESDGVVYEKGSGDTTKKATYSINKMSKEERAALVQQMKNDQAAREQSLISLVTKMMSKQANTSAYAGEDGIWKFIASGKYTVDAATKAQAQKDIAEDGYWGVKQTSQRIFDFASALAGDDVDKMKEMQAAVEKGFKLAGKAWGGDLPGISQDTFAATNKLFEEYYKSKESAA